jgi:hypothetical protein
MNGFARFQFSVFSFQLATDTSVPPGTGVGLFEDLDAVS